MNCAIPQSLCREGRWLFTTQDGSAFLRTGTVLLVCHWGKQIIAYQASLPQEQAGSEMPAHSHNSRTRCILGNIWEIQTVTDMSVPGVLAQENQKVQVRSENRSPSSKSRLGRVKRRREYQKRMHFQRACQKQKGPFCFLFKIFSFSHTWQKWHSPAEAWLCPSAQPI